LHVAVDERDRAGQVCVETWATAAIAAVLLLLGRFPLMRPQRVEPLEYQAAVVAKQLVQSQHADEKHRVIIVTLYPLTLAPRALHTIPF
jgi:hypothetical protein